MEAQLGVRGVLLEAMLGPALHVKAKGGLIEGAENERSRGPIDAICWIPSFMTC
jgi:hypothetical protein